jgi:hypothetical protein
MLRSFEEIVNQANLHASKDAIHYTGTIHGNLCGDNVLTDCSGAVWVINWYKKRKGHVLYDLACFLTSLLFESTVLRNDNELSLALGVTHTLSTLPTLDAPVPNARECGLYGDIDNQESVALITALKGITVVQCYVSEYVQSDKTVEQWYFALLRFGVESLSSMGVHSRKAPYFQKRWALGACCSYARRLSTHLVGDLRRKGFGEGLRPPSPELLIGLSPPSLPPPMDNPISGIRPRNAAGTGVMMQMRRWMKAATTAEAETEYHYLQHVLRTCSHVSDCISGAPLPIADQKVNGIDTETKGEGEVLPLATKALLQPGFKPGQSVEICMFGMIVTSTVTVMRKVKARQDKSAPTRSPFSTPKQELRADVMMPTGGEVLGMVTGAQVRASLCPLIISVDSIR